MLFTSSSSAILLNGVPGKKFYCLRGVRKGDPLSPLLFVLAADLLQSILNKAMQMGLLSSPLQVNSCPDFPVVQYADDTLLFVDNDHRTAINLKWALAGFELVSGMSINYHKSELVPINLEEAEIQAFLDISIVLRGNS